MELQSHTTSAPALAADPADPYTPPAFWVPRCLFTRTVPDPAMAPISLDLVIFYTWIHALIFCAIGAVAAKLLALAERELDVGFGIVLLFVIFEFGFVAAAMIFAEPILRAVALPAVLVGNLLAAGTVAVCFWHRHSKLP